MKCKDGILFQSPLQLMILVSCYFYIVNVYNVHILFHKHNFDYLALIQCVK